MVLSTHTAPVLFRSSRCRHSLLAISYLRLHPTTSKKKFPSPITTSHCRSSSSRRHLSFLSLPFLCMEDHTNAHLQRKLATPPLGPAFRSATPLTSHCLCLVISSCRHTTEEPSSNLWPPWSHFHGLWWLRAPSAMTLDVPMIPRHLPQPRMPEHCRRPLEEVCWTLQPETYLLAVVLHR